MSELSAGVRVECRCLSCLPVSELSAGVCSRTSVADYVARWTLMNSNVIDRQTDTSQLQRWLFTLADELLSSEFASLAAPWYCVTMPLSRSTVIAYVRWFKTLSHTFTT